MTLLVEVFSELFRLFGYAPRLHAQLDGSSGRKWSAPLLLEKDNRRLALLTWLDKQELPEALVNEAIGLVNDAGLDGALVLSLGAVPEPLTSRAARQRIHVWDSRRITQELGTAVLHETCPGLWDHPDPLLAPRASRILEKVHEEARHQSTLPTAPAPTSSTAPLAVTPGTPTAPTSAPSVGAPTPISPPPSAAPNPLPTAPSATSNLAPASPHPTPAATFPPTAERPIGEFQLPLAFGVLDQVVNQPVQIEPPPVAPPTPPTATAPRPERAVLRVQVSKGLALSLVKNKLRHVEHVFLRLVPHYVFDYEAQLLLEGSLQSETRKGRMGVDASTKKVLEWHQALEPAPLPAEGVDVDEKKVRLAESDAQKLLLGELKTLVTRAVVMQEDDSEWSVMVRKKVTLADNDVRITSHGVYWVPIWRLSGKDGSMEIDASTGQILFEEVLLPRADAQLI